MQIHEIASFELIPLGELIEMVFDLPEDDGEELIQAFEDYGFESYYTMINLGSLSIVLFLSVMIPLMLLLFFKPLNSVS